MRLAPYGREAARHRADAALQVHPHHPRPNWRGSRDHLLCVGAAALDLGAFTAFLYAFNQREKIYNIMETRSRASASTPATPASAG